MLYLRLALDNIFSQFKRFFISILLVVVCLTMVTYLVTIYVSAGYGYNTCDKLLTQGFDGTGVVTINLAQQDIDMDGFKNDVQKRKEVGAIGGMVGNKANMPQEFYEVQKENMEGIFVTERGVGGKSTSIISIDVSALKVCDFEISEGIKPEELDFGSESDEKNIEYTSYLYLGSAYSNIPIGKEYREEYVYDDIKISYVSIVAGKLAEGQRWIDPGIATGMDSSDLDYTADCTYGVFEVRNDHVSNELFITASKGYSLDAAIQAAYEVAQVYGIDLLNRTLTDIYEESCEYTVLLLSYFGDALLLVIPAMILMLITMQIVSVMQELNSYGVMCAVGYSLKDINIMLIIKNIILAAVSVGIAAPIVIVLLEVSYRDEFKLLSQTLLLSTSLPVAILIMLIVILITSSTTVIMLKQYTPVKLMGKRN